MDVALKNALAGPARTFTSVRIELPAVGGEGGADAYVIRLLNGGEVVIGGEPFTGHDPVFGTLDSTSSFADGVGDQASSASVILLTASDAALERLVSPLSQGAPVLIRQGAVNEATGAAIGAETLFQGMLNHAVLVTDDQRRAVRLELITEEALALEPNDERRLSHAYHQHVWGTGELGLIHITGVTQKDFWRIRKPAVTYAGGGYGGGGGGSGGLPGGGGADMAVIV